MWTAQLKRLLRAPATYRCLREGLVEFERTGNTPPAAHQALIQLFCLDGGRTLERLSREIAAANPAYALAEPSGVLGEMTPGRLAEVDRDLRTRGFHVFDTRLPDTLSDALMHVALTTPCWARQSDAGPPTSPLPSPYPREAPAAVRYDFAPRDLVAHEAIQALLADRSLLAVAQAYLGSAPVIDVITMWWHTAFSKQPDKEAAQFYHFDMDRVRWLKFFFYLTDVEAENGPHCFIEGSQQTAGIPPTFLSKGYVRLMDDEVLGHYGSARQKVFTGLRGTIIAEDTRGLHKGQHVLKGDRLVFQLQFSNSLFGANLTPVACHAAADSPLGQMWAKYTRLYSYLTPLEAPESQAAVPIR